MNIKTIKFSVPDMHCEACPKLITMNLKELKGVKGVEADLETKMVTVTHTEGLAKEAIIDNIKESGYTAEVIDGVRLPRHEYIPRNDEEVVEEGSKKKSEPDSQVAYLEISGMHCSSCAGIIEKSLLKTNGVSEANVNFATSKARIKFETKLTNLSGLVSAVKSTGYGAEVPSEKNARSETEKRAVEINFWFTKFMAGLMLSLPMLFFMVYDFVPNMPWAKVIMPISGLTRSHNSLIFPFSFAPISTINISCSGFSSPLITLQIPIGVLKLPGVFNTLYRLERIVAKKSFVLVLP